jgi:hypothetical protein
LLVVSFVGLLLAALLGVVSQKVWSPITAGDQNELNIVQSAALTLLRLIVGFSFAMAISHYDQRGEGLSAKAVERLEAAWAFVQRLMGERSVEDWRRKAGAPAG